MMHSPLGESSHVIGAGMDSPFKLNGGANDVPADALVPGVNFDFLSDYMLGSGEVPVEEFQASAALVNRPEFRGEPTQSTPSSDAEASDSPRKSARLKSQARQRKAGGVRGRKKCGKLTKPSPCEVPWRPARGRGRQAQLARMTEDEKASEAAWRLEKNRIAARDCRRTKKLRLEALVDERDALEETVRRLTDENAALRAQLGSFRPEAGLFGKA